MKTPKTATPMPKSKLNTPRAGFIKKSGSSVKQKKGGALEKSVLDISGTPKIDTLPLKKVQPVALNNSPKKNKYPLNNVNMKNESPLKTPIMSPFKRKVMNSAEDGDENLIKKQRSPKTENKTEKTPPGKKSKNNKASPEVQLGLDIEHFLDKSSVLNKSKEMGKNTPLGINKKENKTVNPNKKNKKRGGKERKNIQNQKGMSENNEIVPVVTLRNAVNALVKYVNENPKEKKVIFGEEVPFYFQVNYIQMPVANRARISVPNSILPQNADVALIIADKKGAEEKDLDDVIDEMKERFKKGGVTEIPEIIPWRKACKENTQYEQKQKFVDRFDLILVDSKLMKMFKKYFGHSFTKNRLIVPVTINFDKDISKIMAKATRQLPVSFKGKGLTKSMKFGHYKMSEKHLVENLDAILKELSKNSYIHGSTDIKSILIKTQRSISFPLYMTTKTANSVKPHPPKVTKKNELIAEGELSTFTDKIVKVYQDGVVRTIRIKMDENDKNTDSKLKTENVEDDEIDEDENDSEDDYDDDDDDDDDIEEDIEDFEFESDEDSSDKNMSQDEEEININKLKNKKPQKGKSIKGLQSNEEENEESTDEDQLGAAEEMFLNELRREQDNIESKSVQQKGKVASPSSQDKVSQLQKNQQPQKGKNLKRGKNNEDKDDDDQLGAVNKKFMKQLNAQNKGKNLPNQNKKPQLKNNEKKGENNSKIPGGNKQMGQQKFAQKSLKNFQQKNMTKETIVKTEGETLNKKSKNRRRRNKKKGSFGSGQASPQQTKVLASPKGANKFSPKGKKAQTK